MKPEFSVVVISYNGKEFLRQTLAAIFKSSFKPKKIIAVDDCSADGTEEMIKTEFPGILFTKTRRNSGPAAARNRGAKFAEGEYIIFLDNDVLVQPNTFEKLVNFMETCPEAGLTGAKIIPKMWWNMGYDFNNFRSAVGFFFGFLLKIFPRSRRLKNASMKFVLNYWDYDKTLAVDWVVEMCFIVKREIFEKVGGFDEYFFFWHEGPDLCKRIRNLGHKIYFYPQAEVFDLKHHTLGSWKRAKEFLRSEYHYYKKHYFYKKSNPVFMFLGRILSSIFYRLG